ncbi:MAG TPA: aspartate-semialdehyde dehydrogenase [Pseudolabrys sp.]|nr:aspartate-semialdehyde dehydrogenase [Pseudolabrys sp.]
MVSSDFAKQVEGYGLTTAHILYRLPDYQNILQTYVWQEYDLSPDFPTLKRFLTFWKQRIEGPLHSVTIAHHQLIKAADFRFSEEIRLH